MPRAPSKVNLNRRRREYEKILFNKHRNQLNNFSDRKLANANNDTIREWKRALEYRLFNGEAPIPNNFFRPAEINKINKLSKVLVNRGKAYRTAAEAERKRYNAPHRRFGRWAGGLAVGAARGVGGAVKNWVKTGGLQGGKLRFGVGTKNQFANEVLEIMNRARAGENYNYLMNQLKRKYAGHYYINTNELKRRYRGY
jgi:hypothetical protein